MPGLLSEFQDGVVECVATMCRVIKCRQCPCCLSEILRSGRHSSTLLPLAKRAWGQSRLNACKPWGWSPLMVTDTQHAQQLNENEIFGISAPRGSTKVTMYLLKKFFMLKNFFRRLGQSA